MRIGEKSITLKNIKLSAKSSNHCIEINKGNIEDMAFKAELKICKRPQKQSRNM